MKMSNKTIRAQAIVDMNNWILNFKASNITQNYDTQSKKIYMEQIEKIQTRLLKEI